ncbi:MAG: hypothetical protein RPU52_02495 [Candidatus Sedimenticola sp. (ex Thyasira tokunagai)]
MKRAAIYLLSAMAVGLGLGPLANKKKKNSAVVTTGGRRPRIKKKSSAFGRYTHGTTPNRYTPHQGVQECARRRRQMGIG